MKRRLKLCGVWLSTTLCLAAMVAWGFKVVQIKIDYEFMISRTFAFWIGGCRGGILLGTIDLKKYDDNSWDSAVRAMRVYDEDAPPHSQFEWLRFYGDKIFVKPSLDIMGKRHWGHLIMLPCWLLILLFGVPPAFWWRRRYVERRNQKFFEQIVTEKKAEQKAKEETQ